MKEITRSTWLDKEEINEICDDLRRIGEEESHDGLIKYLEILSVLDEAQNSAAEGDFKSVLYDVEYIKQQYNVNWRFALALNEVESIACLPDNDIIRDDLHFALRNARYEL